ncbi:phage repressor protein [Lactococcus piscium]|uniref:Antirepressor n=1 Tax=Pseudolactococcus paracarnosus TaxID=2749962 RepID=A0A7L4WBL4_9LACT|nr:BRO family protein [Lactococcus paracarnosus]MCJ1993619.1 phage repressor protein [Lactococcus paracarnosus]QDJ27718.1 antirepressor [Lactococcus paracarnosus]SPC36064.1 Toxin-antitoxin system, toxin component, Bro protein [Lactococcus piscium]
MKKELWNGHKIRFVEIKNEWWAVAKDIADALDYAETRNMINLIPDKYTSSCKLDDKDQRRNYIIISEFGIYKAIFGSKKKEANEFQEWVFEVIKQLRQSLEIEGFKMFRMFDKDHQKVAMGNLSAAISDPNKKDFIKANTIANKAVSNLYGYKKMIKKENMTPDMIVSREIILDETVQLMSFKEKYKLKFSISEKVYDRSGETKTA